MVSEAQYRKIVAGKTEAFGKQKDTVVGPLLSPQKILAVLIQQIQRF
jgi:hypothetical protein